MTCQDPLSPGSSQTTGGPASNSAAFHLCLSAGCQLKEHPGNTLILPRLSKTGDKGPFSDALTPASPGNPYLEVEPQLGPDSPAPSPLANTTYQQSVTQRFSSGERGAPSSTLYPAQVTHPASESRGRTPGSPPRADPGLSRPPQSSDGLLGSSFPAEPASALAAGQRPESSHHRSEPTRVPDLVLTRPQPHGTAKPWAPPTEAPTRGPLAKPTNTSAASPAALGKTQSSPLTREGLRAQGVPTNACRHPARPALPRPQWRLQSAAPG